MGTSMSPRLLGVAFFLCLAYRAQADQPQSTCYGSSSQGRLANGWKLPVSGVNFETYSGLGSKMGRTYVHSEVYEVVLDAYAELAKIRPQRKFQYGETGWANGGRFYPHKTHQNGLSVDFMVPVIDTKSKPALLPTGMFNKYGYGIEFDKQGRYKDLRIDFSGINDHLSALARAAERRGVKIKLVIFENGLQDLLKANDRWTSSLDGIPFLRGPVWIRHDEHYHVDFDVPCESVGGKS